MVCPMAGLRPAILIKNAQDRAVALHCENDRTMIIDCQGGVLAGGRSVFQFFICEHQRLFVDGLAVVRRSDEHIVALLGGDQHHHV
jgi:hypothetical protein